MSFRIIFITISLFFITSLKSQNIYESFLKDNYSEPKEYIRSLFKTNDLVLICEREHPEMTQYDFFYELVSQPWFSFEVGTVIVEVSSRSIQIQLDELLMSQDLNDEILNSKLRNICQDMTHSVLWTKSNFYHFLKRVYNLNQSLVKEEKIRIIGADVAFSWQEIKTSNDYNKFKKTLGSRDKEMAQLVLDWHSQSLKEKKKSKALVIMNYRHAYANKYWTSANRHPADNVGRYIKEGLPEKFTNVYFHSFAYMRLFGLRKRHVNGKWDNAFKKNGNNPIAFNLQESPFGEDIFDDYPYIRTDLKWNDVFGHILFYNSLNECINSFGIEGIVDDEFQDELNRRFELCGLKLTKRKIKNYNTERPKRIRVL